MSMKSKLKRVGKAAEHEVKVDIAIRFNEPD